MISSTSSSNDRLPTGGWPATWLLAAGLVVTLVTSWEGFWRLRGFEPHVSASTEAWVQARRRVRPQSTVIAGSSRIQAAIEPEVWQAELGGSPPSILAIPGGTPLPILEDLAADSTFRGLVVADVLPYFTFDLDHHDRVTTEYLPAYRRSLTSPAVVWEAFLRVQVSGHLAFRREELLPQRLIDRVVEGTLPPPPVVVQRPDRFNRMMFRKRGVQGNAAPVLDSLNYLRLARNVRPARGPALDSILGRLRTSIQRIQARGGRVVLLSFPACGGRAVIEQRLYPAAEYWSRIPSLGAAINIDMATYPTIAGLPCYDGSHLDSEDAPRAVRLITRLLTDRRIVAPPTA